MNLNEALHLSDSEAAAIISGLFVLFGIYFTWRAKLSEKRIDLSAAGLQAQLAGWEKLVAGLRNRVVDLESDLDRYSNRAEALERKLAEAEGRERDLTIKLNNAQREISSLNGELARLRKD